MQNALLPTHQEVSSTPSPFSNAGLNGADLVRLRRSLERSVSDNTRASYRSAWKTFEHWARTRPALAMPASPPLVTIYLSHLAEERRLSVATVRLRRAAIAAIHKANGHQGPTDNEGVRRVMKGIARAHGRATNQAKPLTAEAPGGRQGHSASQAPPGRREETGSAERVSWKAWADLALLSVLRDGLLRRSEAAALTRGDVELRDNGTAWSRPVYPTGCRNIPNAHDTAQVTTAARRTAMTSNQHLNEELPLKPIDLDQPFITRQRSLSRSTIGDFWRWAYSDIANNANRGVLAEFIVGKALGSTERVRTNWAAYDVDSRKGIKVEVKSAAYLQSWAQEKPSTPRFDVSKVQGWDNETEKYITQPRRHADVYVFCLLAYQENKLMLNPMDLSQWEFYVVSTWRLNQDFDDYRTLGQSQVQGLSHAYRVEDLQRAVSAVLK